MNKTIYTLHEFGSPSHFYGLEELARRDGYKIKHREISQKNALKRLIFNFDFHIMLNLLFFLSLPFMKKSKIVIAIAPYNRFVTLWMKILKKHEVYYFTSYTCWDQTLSVHDFNGNMKLIDSWRYFTSTYVKHIFAVSNRTKTELINNNFSTSERVSVVYHSLKKDIEEGNQVKSLSFIQVGRLVPEKGIYEILEFFKCNLSYNITFVGNGEMHRDVEEAAKKYNNINYLGYIKSFDELVELYKKHSFVLLNSQQLPSSTWEELFGIAIIEGMACGCVPIASDHSGPKEIIINNENGILYNSKYLDKTLFNIATMTEEQYSQIRQNSIASAQQYYRRNIAKRWSAILKSCKLQNNHLERY